jgi:AcrR family transcriptional regulator
MATRKYRSPLRKQQANATRQRILDAAGRITVLDIARVTHAAVARAAGVAERTVYRHFPTVASLHDAFAKLQEERFGRDNAEEFAIGDLAALYERWPARIKDTGMLELLLEQEEPRPFIKSRRERYARLERALRPLVPRATPTQRRQLVLVFGALVSAEVFRRGKLVLDLDPEQVVPGPAWALRVLIDSLRKGKTPWS